MEFNRKSLCIILLAIMFIIFLLCVLLVDRKEETVIEKVISPVSFVLSEGTVFNIGGVETFEPDYTENNKLLAAKLGLSEDEAFIFGNLGKYWAKNILEGRRVLLRENDLIYYKFGYPARFKNSPYCFINGVPINKHAYERQLGYIRRGKFVIVDLDTDSYYPVSKADREKVKNFVVVRKSHIKNTENKTVQNEVANVLYNPVYQSPDYKIIVSDLTTKLKPDRNCSSDICREIVSNINKTQHSIDMAIYGYSSTPEIEKALTNAQKRGVKLRIVFDADAKGENIYPDTFGFMKMFTDNVSDKNSSEVRNTMHNKFYVFDGETVITGSANLSHTDMSGYNSNSIIIIERADIAERYLKEFEQMYHGKFHNSKVSNYSGKAGNIDVFFSPCDKGISKGVLPLIRSAKNYIYIPAFVITEKNITSELINAKRRGVDVRIILDALNASTQHSKHRELRNAGIQVKAENYAGKMHSKTMVIDDKYLIMGSMNFSNSGENRNDENMVILDDSGAAKFYKQFFLYQWSKIPDKWLKYTPRAEGKDSTGSCEDGLDNNYDGKTDKEDEACKA